MAARSDRLLGWAIWRRAGGDATAGVAAGDWHAEHPVDPGAAQDQDLFDEQGQPRADWLARQAGRFLDELEWYARALKAARTGGVPY